MMIQSQSYCFSGIVTLYSFFLLSFTLHTLASPTSHYCRDDQRDALLEFTDEFPVNKSCSSISYSRAFCSWNKSGDCCYWEGVKCDAKSGQVISLELDFISPKNSLKPNSGLFKLQYLQSLSLLYCDLYGEIPSSIGNLSRLTYLELMNNHLVGQIPDSIGNLSRLTYLVLGFNNLVGQIPASIGNLSRLIYLDLGDNNLVGQIPDSIENLSRLTELSLGSNKLVGQIPPSIGNLTQLEYMYLCRNNFSGSIPSSFANLKKLTTLDISFNQFINFPLIFSNLTRLSSLYLGSNNFQSTLDMSGFHNLEKFDVSANSFFGPFPTSLFKIPSLQSLNLEGNKFKGPIEFGNTSSSSKLQNLNLANNQFDGPLPESISKLFNLESLDLSDNHFTGRIPRSISKLVNLNHLDMSNNKLQGEVLPSCLRRLMTVKLSHNAFSSFGRSWEDFDDSQIQVLKLDSNSFQGPFSHWICKFRFLSILDLSNNLFNGSIPPCLRNFTNSLKVLVLRNNSFSGILPDIFANATNLDSLDVSRNQLEGKIPKSLINCYFMRFLNVGNNKIKDNFPSWLGSSPLNVLLLRSNRFYGPLYHHHESIGFESLRVIDISHNDFTGTLPPFYFSDWSEMSTSTRDENEDPVFDSPYMDEIVNSSTFYNDSMEMVNKGVDMEFERIHKHYKAIDFSGNRFYGSIPKSIGLLKELHLLNLSGNTFTGNIPQSLEKLTNLEALDLSRNQLSGQIPQDLGNLSSLSYMNFSNNLLEGIVPRGTQFQRQECSSFMKNPKLYGLEDICGKTHVLNPTPQESKELPEPKEQVINWIAAAIAYAPGVFCGLVIGHIFASHKHKWFMEKFGRNKPRAVTVSAR